MAMRNHEHMSSVDTAWRRMDSAGSSMMIVGVSATAKLNRSDWALSKYVPAVGDAVSLYITGELVLQDTGE